MSEPKLPPHWIINQAADAVRHSLLADAALRPNVAPLQAHNVLVRTDWQKDRVAIISGGGSGHEPSHAGWVADGMLTAAVCGSVFASPSTAEVLAAILHVTGDAGCLVIVKNYTGDRLNFGLACEHAKAAGKRVELLVVGDDCALPNRGLGIAGRRGLAGTVLVHKVAGAVAAAGGGLDEVVAEARAAADLVGTVGVGLQRCRPFGQPADAPCERIAPGMMELGLGIHGEKGAAVCPIVPCDQMVKTLLDMLLSQAGGFKYLELQAGDEVALLVNNLGATTPIELGLAARAAMAELRGRGVRVGRCYVGPYMTALDMAGISLSVLKLDARRLGRLDAPTASAHWTAAVEPRLPEEVVEIAPPAFPPAAQSAIPRPTGPPSLMAAQQERFADAIRAAAEALIALEPRLTEWDTKVGDGDCGHTLKGGAQAILADLPSYPLGHPREAIAALGCSIRRSMGGTSGVLYDIFASAASAALSAGSAPTVTQVAEAFMAGVSAISRYGGAAAGDRTMLDALAPAGAAMLAGTTVGDALARAAIAAAGGAEKTKAMAAAAGRSSYVMAEALCDVPDPGAMGAAAWLAAASAALTRSH